MNLINPKIETRLTVAINNDIMVNAKINSNENNTIRNYVIYSLYLNQLREGTPAMQIYENIECYLRESLNIKLAANRIRGIIAEKFK